MTIVDLHPLTDRLAALVVAGKWSEAAAQADLIAKLASAIAKRMEKRANG